MLLKSEKGMFKLCCRGGKVKLPLMRVPPEMAAAQPAQPGGAADDVERGDVADDGGGAGGARVPEPSEAEELAAARRILLRFRGVSREDACFRKHIRALNNSLALASQSVRRHEQPAGRGPPTFTVQGMVYHQIGPLEATEGNEALNAQTYFVDTSLDTNAATTVRISNQRFANVTSPEERQRISCILQELHDDLIVCNPYVRDLRSIYDMSPAEVGERTFVIAPESRPSDEHARRYNVPVGMNEIAVMVGDEPAKRDIVVRLRGGGIRRIDDTHRAFLPLHYVLLDPLGTHGWDYTMTMDSANDRAKRLTAAMFFAFHVHSRPGHGQSETLLRAGSLFREWLCCGWAMIENQNLQYLAKNQKKLRADLYQNVVDHTENDDAVPDGVGRRIILPATFQGGRRHEMEMFQDALALTRTYGKPALFVTFTCNPKWPEITASLHEGQTATDRPDVVARVFRARAEQLKSRLRGKGGRPGVFGPAGPCVVATEFQKRELPHTHTVLWLDDPIHTAEDVDRYVCAEIPPEGPLREAVKKFMVHEPCGVGSRCWNGKEDGCSAGFPFDFSGETVWQADGYPLLRRRSPRDGGRSFVDRNGRVIDNSWIVPFNPYLLLSEDSHCNVMVISSLNVLKYLFKYIYKGPDRAMVPEGGILPAEPNANAVVGGDDARGGGGPREVINEIQRYQDLRYFGSCEAAYRIFGFPLHSQWPATMKLRIHLEDLQLVLFEDGEAEEAVADGPPVTHLTAWFALNAEAAANGEELPPAYIRMPKTYTWKQKRKQWCKKARGDNGTIGRLPFINPSAGEVFYLRTLLLNEQSRGSKSFAEMRTVDGVLRDTFRDACLSLGLLRDDDQWRQTMETANEHMMPAQLRELFVTILEFNFPSDPGRLLEAFLGPLTEDLLRIIRGERQRGVQGAVPAGDEDTMIRALLLLDIQHRLQSGTPEQYGLTTVPPGGVRDSAMRFLERFANVSTRVARGEAGGGDDVPNQLIVDELTFDRVANEQKLAADLASMNREQRQAYDAVHAAVERGEGGVFFLNAPAGTGKTFVSNAILRGVRAREKIALATATSGIAAILLLKGRTFHSRFKVPLDLAPTSTFGVSRNDDVGALMQRVSLIVFDEAPMGHKFLMEKLDDMLRDVRRDTNRPFGGVVLLMSGDFAQNLPVVKRGGRARIVAATIKRSTLWTHVRQLRLIVNMRTRGAGDNDTTARFNAFLKGIGDGAMNEFPRSPGVGADGGTDKGERHVRIPERFVHRGNLQELVRWAFPDLDGGRGGGVGTVLASTNRVVKEINDMVFEAYERAADVTECLSADELLEDALGVPVEVLNANNQAGLPPHRLRLKIGVPVMLLRNLNPSRSLMNGSVLLFDGLINNCLMRLKDRETGDAHLIPKIELAPKDGVDTYRWRRTQFPVCVAFAFTVAKSQGQTCKGRVAVYMPKPVFAHGSLYVALSRVTDPENLRVYLPMGEHLPRGARRSAEGNGAVTVNVTFREVLD